MPLSRAGKPINKIPRSSARCSRHFVDRHHKKKTERFQRRRKEREEKCVVS